MPTAMTPLNARTLLEQERIDRGPITAADGAVLARSVRGAEGTYQRVYPTREQFAHAIGYYYTDLGSAGLEKYRDSALNGQSGSNLQRILDQLQGKQQKGDKVVTTLDPAAQQVANSARRANWQWLYPQLKPGRHLGNEEKLCAVRRDVRRCSLNRKRIEGGFPART